MEQVNKFKNLKELVEIWAKEKGIMEKATPLTQHGKTEEEVNELGISLIAQNNDLKMFLLDGKEVDTNHEIKDAIGDIMVTLIIQAKMQKLEIIDCLEMAYNTISKRKGKMINGVFVKSK